MADTLVAHCPIPLASLKIFLKKTFNFCTSELAKMKSNMAITKTATKNLACVCRKVIELTNNIWDARRPQDFRYSWIDWEGRTWKTCSKRLIGNIYRHFLTNILSTETHCRQRVKGKTSSDILKGRMYTKLKTKRKLKSMNHASAIRLLGCFN